MIQSRINGFPCASLGTVAAVSDLILAGAVISAARRLASFDGVDPLGCSVDQCAPGVSIGMLPCRPLICFLTHSPLLF